MRSEWVPGAQYTSYGARVAPGPVRRRTSPLIDAPDLLLALPEFFPIPTWGHDVHALV